MFRSWHDALNWWRRKRGKPEWMPRCLATPEELKHINRALMLGACGGVSGPLINVRAAQEAGKRVEEDSSEE